MTRKISRTGSGQFQWNPGGWFGSQLGGTIWMLILGVMMLVRLPLLGAIALLLAAFDRTGHLSELDPHFRSNPRGLYLILLMFPVLMGMFHFQNHAGKK